MAKRFNSTMAKIKNSDGEYEPIPTLKGETPYEIAVRNGFEGTEEDWFNLNFDEGWVTKYQELENKKANKTAVYTKQEVDDVINNKVTPLEEKEANYRSVGTFLMADRIDHALAVSPSGMHYCRWTGDNKYGVEVCNRDGSVIGTILTNIHSNYTNYDPSRVRIEMDDNFIVGCYSNHNYSYPNYFYGSGEGTGYSMHTFTWKYYEFTDASINEVTISGAPGESSRYKLHYNKHQYTSGETADSNKFWFTSVYNKTNTQYPDINLYLHCIDKNTKSVTTISNVTVTLEDDPSTFLYKLYRDGADAILLYRDASGYVNVVRVSGDSITTLAHFTNSTASAALNLVDSEIIFGSLKVYDFSGTLLRSATPSGTTSSVSVINDLIIFSSQSDDEFNTSVYIYDLHTLSKVSSVDVVADIEFINNQTNTSDSRGCLRFGSFIKGFAVNPETGLYLNGNGPGYFDIATNVKCIEIGGRISE